MGPTRASLIVSFAVLLLPARYMPTIREAEAAHPARVGADAKVDGRSRGAAGAGGAGVTAAPPTLSSGGSLVPCDGSPRNCDRRYDQVTYLATHNAFSYALGGNVHYLVPNQSAPVSRQLLDGVRALGLRPSPYFGDEPSERRRVYVTHNPALRGILGQEPFADVLTEVRAFLETHPDEVVTIFSESAVPSAQFADAFSEAGLLPYLHTQRKGDPWPTLRQMIDRNQRLVVFDNSADAHRPAWQHALWDFVVDTDFHATDRAHFSCAYYRGDKANSLYFLNHFVYRDVGMGVFVPDPDLSAGANEERFVFARAKRCWDETKRVPNFVYVDWYGRGNAMKAVTAVNELPRPGETLAAPIASVASVVAGVSGVATVPGAATATATDGRPAVPRRNETAAR